MEKMRLLNYLFPKSCLECKKKGRYLCLACAAKIERRRTVCPVCQRISVNGSVHLRCKTSLSLDGLTSLWPYTGVIRKGIIAMKYRFAYEIAHEISQLAALKLKCSYPDIALTKAILIPIPTTRQRCNWRGFNQSEEIGKAIANKLGWKYTNHLLIRKGITPPQTGLKGKARSKNIRGVFILNPRYTLIPKSFTLILFDDVWTTGSTLKEAAKVLKRKNTNRVWGLTIAKS